MNSIFELPEKGKGRRFFSRAKEPHKSSANLLEVLLLSKRGLSRAPLAREILRKHLGSDSPGRIRIAARGTTEAYDQCPIDRRMSLACEGRGYFLEGLSRFALRPDLAQADIIITMDGDSDEFVRANSGSIRGQVKPFGLFLPGGSEPHLPDPFLEREDDHESHYRKLVLSVETGCENLRGFLAALCSK